MRKLLTILIVITLSSSCFAYVPVPYTNSHTHKGELILSDYYDNGYKTVRGKNLVDYDTMVGIGILNGLNLFIDGKYIKCSEDKAYTISTVVATYRYNECGHYQERRNVIKDIRDATAEEEHQLYMVEKRPLFQMYDPIKDTYVITFKSFRTDFIAVCALLLIGAMIFSIIALIICCIKCIKG